MKKLILFFTLFLFTCLNAQSYFAIPVVDTTEIKFSYKVCNRDIEVIELKDGSAWITTGNSCEYIDKKLYNKWKRKHIRFKKN